MKRFRFTEIEASLGDIEAKTTRSTIWIKNRTSGQKMIVSMRLGIRHHAFFTLGGEDASDAGSCIDLLQMCFLQVVECC